MKKISKIIISLFLLSVFFVPAFSFADTSAFPVNTSANPDLSSTGGSLTVPCPKKGCGFQDLLKEVDKVVKYILWVSVYIAAIMFIYAGFIMITAGGESSEAVTKAKKIATGVVLGMFFIGACYIIVKLVLTTLGYKFGFIF